MKEKLSIIDNQVKNKQSYYIRIFILLSLLVFLIIGLLDFFYLSAYYLDVPYKNFFLNNLKSLYYPDKQWMANTLVLSLSVLVTTLFSTFALYRVSRKYRVYYKKIVCDEIELSGYSFIKLRSMYEEVKFEKLYQYLNIKNVENEYLFTLKKENSLNFYQLHSKEKKGRFSLLIKMETKEKFSHFLQIRTSGEPRIDSFNNENIFMFSFPSTKYIKDFRVYSSYGKNTNKIFNTEFLKYLNEMTLYCKNDFIVSCYDNEIYILFRGWKINLTDHLFKKICNGQIVSKVESISTLYNYFDKLYNEIGEQEEKI